MGVRVGADVGPQTIELVTHSTTQAVNALLMISRAIAHEFLDLSAGFDASAARHALVRLVDADAQAVCVAEAFAPDDFGDPTLDVRGEAILIDGSSGEPLTTTIGSVVARHIRNVGPITVPPTTWVVHDGRIRELADPDAIADTVGAGADAVIVGRT